MSGDYHLFSAHWVAARKPHRCIWCSQRIAPTEVYMREHSVYDYQHQNHAWHWDCWFDALRSFEEYGDENFISGNDRPEMLPFRSMEAS